MPKNHLISSQVNVFRPTAIGCTTLFISLFISSMAFGQVHFERAISFPTKKTKGDVLRTGPHNSLWMLNQKTSSIEQLSDEGTITTSIEPNKKLGLKKPVDFSFSPKGDLVVSDLGSKSLLIIRGTSSENEINWAEAELVRAIPIDIPSAVAVSHDDILAMGDEKSHGINIYSYDGILLHTLFSPNEQEIKTITALSFSKDGNLFVLDGKAGRLHRFSSKRKWLGATENLSGGMALALGPTGNAFVTIDQGSWIEIDPAGKIVSRFGSKGKEEGKFRKPNGITFQNENIWVIDAGNQRLQEFSMSEKNNGPALKAPSAQIQIRKNFELEGPYQMAFPIDENNVGILNSKSILFQVTSHGEIKEEIKRRGKKSDGFRDPVDAAVDPNGHVWIVDADDHTLKQIDASGEIVETFGSKGGKAGEIKNPNRAAFLPDNTFLVVDKNFGRLQAINAKGLFLFEVGHSGKNEGDVLEYTGLAVNQDQIGVIDNARKAFLLFDHKANFKREISNREDRSPIWGNLADVASDAGGRFYILDTEYKRVRIFDAGGRFLADFASDADRIFSLGGQKILTIGKNNVVLYSVHPVPEPLDGVNLEVSDGDLILTWLPEERSQNYRVYRKDEEKDFELIQETTEPKFKDTGTIPGKMVTYALAGANAIGYEGQWVLTNSVKAPRKSDVSLISIESVDLDPVFTAAYKYYARTPIGKVTIRNNDSKPFRDVKLSLTLKRYSDFSSETTLPILNPGESKEIPVTMTLNDTVLELTEDTPTQVSIEISFFEKNQEQRISKNSPVTLYSRNAISWRDKGRMASFITPKDPPIVEFSREGIKAFLQPLKASTVGKPLAKAALFFESMAAMGVSYVEDPTTPYSKVSTDPDIIDFVQFPRETMRRQTGDCDDTTALLSALLESIGVQTALVDMPGHIFMMANLEETDPDQIGFPESQFVEFQGTLWVPIETTKLNGTFIDSWNAALQKVREGEKDGKIEFIPFNEARENYTPVTLTAAAENIPPYPIDKVQKSFPAVLEQLQNQKFENRLAQINEKIKNNPNNIMLQIEKGMIYVEGGKTEEGETIFKSLLEADSTEVQAAAKNNLGNLAYLGGHYKSAIKYYEEAATLSPADGGILINQARAAWRLKKNDEATQYLREARTYLADWKEYIHDLPANIIPED